MMLAGGEGLVDIEAVTVCVNYSDFLQAVIPWNLPHFSRWVIVTTPGDEETREVCRKFGLETLLTEEGCEPGQAFNKGRMVERGMQQLSADAWHLHIDADIALPGAFNRLLTSARVEASPHKIYGCDRLMVRSWDAWQALLKSGYLNREHDYHCRLNLPPGVEVGSRWVHWNTGYCPIGFFQLAHQGAIEWRGARQRPYPARHGDACRSDVQYALQWDRKDRELLAEVIVVHLESEPAKLGANWKGRTTAKFGAKATTTTQQFIDSPVPTVTPGGVIS